ncbi:ABC transporter permease subunit [Mesorhizobium kowhaii]|uniref:ABC transporter permease subunit n=1 Tax=Mesorhizobium kowhaii TaxID=1300272 RepID=UPI0035EA4742
MIRNLFQQPAALAAPAFVVLTGVFIVPMLWLFFTSLNAPRFSLVNYAAFVAQPANIRVLIQTIQMSFVSTGLCIIIGYPAAYLIASASKRVRLTLIVLVVIPYLTSLLARTYAWIVILGDRGLINSLILDAGLISSPLPLIYNRTAVYLGMVHIMLPVMILPLVSVMIGINRSLVEAARSLGAPPSTAFWRVFFPLSLSGLRSGSVLVFVLSLGFYITPAALGGLRDAMLSSFIAAQVTSSFNLGRIAASAFVLLAIAVAVLSMVGLDLSGSPAEQSGKASRSRFWRFLPGNLGRVWTAMVETRRAKAWEHNKFRGIGTGSRIRALGVAYLVSVMGFLLFPGLVIIVMSFSGGEYLEFPPSSLSFKWYLSFFTDPTWTGALLTSLQVGLAVAFLSVLTGTLAAYGLSRTSPGTRRLVTLVILTPITFPVIVVGIAAYLGLVKMGLVGTRIGIILAHTVGGLGYVVVIVSATLANFDHRLEQAAKSMRAGPVRTFNRVTLPLILPGVIGGAVFAFIHSFDEVVISSLVSGLTIRTLPLKMWENMRHEIDPTIAAVASLLILLPVVWLIVLYGTWKGSVANRDFGHDATLSRQ